MRKADKCQRLHGAVTHLGFFAPVAAGAEYRREKAGLRPQVHAGHHVFEHGHARKQLRRLERPADATRGNSVGGEADQILAVEQHAAGVHGQHATD